MLTDASGRPKVMFDVPKVMSKMPQPPPTYKRGAGQTYVLSWQNICKHMF